MSYDYGSKVISFLGNVVVKHIILIESKVNYRVLLLRFSSFIAKQIKTLRRSEEC